MDECRGIKSTTVWFWPLRMRNEVSRQQRCSAPPKIRALFKLCHFCLWCWAKCLTSPCPTSPRSQICMIKLECLEANRCWSLWETWVKRASEVCNRRELREIPAERLMWVYFFWARRKSRGGEQRDEDPKWGWKWKKGTVRHQEQGWNKGLND